MGAGLRSRSWQANAARMQLAQNMERDGMDFERNRRFTLRCEALRTVTAACSQPQTLLSLQLRNKLLQAIVSLANACNVVPKLLCLPKADSYLPHSRRSAAWGGER